MTGKTRVDKAIRDETAEVRRESRAAAAEVQAELGAAGQETRAALREAMAEVRAALGEVWGEPPVGGTAASSGRKTRAERKEMTRELLLDAAVEVFAEQGYHGASLDDVAEAAGFTKGAVYSNFSRKSDLFRALLGRECRRSNASLRQIIEAVPLELLPDVAGELLRRPESDQAYQILMIEFWLASVRDPGLREVMRETLRDTYVEVGRIVDAKLAVSDARPGLDGHELTVLVDALTTGLAMNLALDPDGGQPQLLAKALHKLLADVPVREASPDPTDAS